MPYNYAADSFHTKKLCSRLSLSEVRFFTEIGRFAFFRPSLGDLGATYDDHLKFIGKRVVIFLLALIELFSLGVTAEALRAIIDSKSAILLQLGPVDPKFQTDRRTDRQTDRQTDRVLIAVPRLHYIQRGKNYVLWMIRAEI